ncbi:uncharacterized protein BX663DRAFT_521114, partial [Cokeromyces recurvatus]|uniref:uncharacterized protein n=1 Tax=Cokeromyces recurvatus TaxID=90255 RepID=UPI00222068F5
MIFAVIDFRWHLKPVMKFLILSFQSVSCTAYINLFSFTLSIICIKSITFFFWFFQI